MSTYLVSRMCQEKGNKNGSGGFTNQVTCKINNLTTEFVCQPFANKWFLLITQYGKIPNLYTVKFDLNVMERPVTMFVSDDESVEMVEGSVIDCGSLHCSVPITVTCLLGPDKTETRGAIQYIINRTKLQSCPHDLVIGVGLKECNGVILAEVAKVLNSML